LGVTEQQEVADVQPEDQSQNLRAFCPRTILRAGSRLINGPTGFTGTFNVPVRVAVTNTSDEVLYSQLHQVPVTIPDGKSNSLFSFVDGNINIPVPEKPSTPS